ncbi:MAG: GNAT family N-acetyltransferase [Chitinophagales bacterium]|nr:GNAT family N-acetyltransferase [Chitinophagales bacterium]
MNSILYFNIRIANSEDLKFAAEIATEINLSSEQRKTGIALRPKEYIADKIKNQLAVIATHPQTGEWLGFACLEVWEHQQYVANTCLIIKEEYRGMGISKLIKTKLFELSQLQFPTSKIFSMSSNPAVLAVNLELGFQPITFMEILNDPWFINGCNSWVGYTSLIQKHASHSNYSVMVYFPENELSTLANDVTAYSQNKKTAIAG